MVGSNTRLDTPIVCSTSSPALACRRMVLRHRTQALKYPPTAIGYPPTGVGYLPTAVGYPPTAVGHPPTAVGHPPTAVGCTPTAAGYCSTAAGRPPTAIGCTPTARLGLPYNCREAMAVKAALFATLANCRAQVLSTLCRGTRSSWKMKDGAGRTPSPCTPAVETRCHAMSD